MFGICELLGRAAVWVSGVAGAGICADCKPESCSMCVRLSRRRVNKVFNESALLTKSLTKFISSVFASYCLIKLRISAFICGMSFWFQYPIQRRPKIIVWMVIGVTSWDA